MLWTTLDLGLNLLSSILTGGSDLQIENFSMTTTIEF